MRNVFMFTPANVATGGIEVMHQLCNTLQKLDGINPQIVYFDKDSMEFVKAEHCDVYKHYNNRITEDISGIDNKNNVIVIPEQHYSFMSKYTKCKKLAWWLSVDAYINVLTYLHRVDGSAFDTPEGTDYYGLNKDKNVYHIVQSAYADSFLKNIMGVNEERIAFLSDYIGDVYMEGQTIPNDEKENIIVYNPAKGLSRIQPIIDLTKDDYKWIPIVNMTPVQVKNLLDRAKLYIDFGDHPGKDRIPREAAMSGCCVITCRRGSAMFPMDVPIPERYKFNDDGSQTKDIISLINDIINEFEFHFYAFEYYREIISQEKDNFYKNAKSVFLQKLGDNGDWNK